MVTNGPLNYILKNSNERKTIIHLMLRRYDHVWQMDNNKSY